MAYFSQFVPKNKVEAARNITDFVQHAREKITIFGADLNFDANRWPLGKYIETKGMGGSILSAKSL